MYTTHSEGADELFVCDVCEAILVSEQGIVEHLRTRHREELLVMDINTIMQEAKARRRGADTAEDHVLENSEASEGDTGTPKIDMTFVERQFYVCSHCDDIFLDKKHLEVHINIRHDLNEKDDDNNEASTFVTPPQTPKPKRFKKRILEGGDSNARVVSRSGSSQTQTPGKDLAPLASPPVTSTPLTPSSVRKAICLSDEAEGDKGIPVRSKDNTAKEKILSDDLVHTNDKDEVLEKKNKATSQKAETKIRLSKRPTRSSQKATPRFSMEEEVTEETDVGPKFSPSEEPALEKENDVNNQTGDAVTNDESDDEPSKDKSRRSVESKPRRSEESSVKHTPSFGISKFYGSTLSSTSPGSRKRPKTPPITVTKKTSDPSPMKVSKSLQKKRKLIPPHKNESTSPATDTESKSVPSSVGMVYQCPTCGDCKEKKDTFKNHFLTHYHNVFTSVLPSSAPYHCPEAECKALSRDKITLMRHYAFTHKKLFTMTDVSEENLKEIMAKALVPKE